MAIKDEDNMQEPMIRSYSKLSQHRAALFSLRDTIDEQPSGSGPLDDNERQHLVRILNSQWTSRIVLRPEPETARKEDNTYAMIRSNSRSRIPSGPSRKWERNAGQKSSSKPTVSSKWRTLQSR